MCRGADKKFKHNACAAVTLSPQMPLNKLTQAAWRMRQIEKGQSLYMVASSEVQHLIWSACGLADGADLRIEHVLEWAVGNTATLNLQVRCQPPPACIDCNESDATVMATCLY
jgi:hypothetical protein